MENETKEPIHGPESNRAKDSKGEKSAQSKQGSHNKNGGPGVGDEVEPMAEQPTQEKSQEENKKLLIMSNQFRDFCMDHFVRRGRVKYDLGQAEHGGYLPADVTFNDLEDEIIDAWIYFQAMKWKMWAMSDEKARQAFTGSRGEQDSRGQ